MPIVSTLSGEKSVACPLNISDPAFDESLKDIITSAGSRWLKNEEVHKLLDSVQEQVVHVTWPQEPAEKPEGGRLFMFSRKVCRGFRNDKHSWRKKQGASADVQPFPLVSSSVRLKSFTVLCLQMVVR